LFYKEVSDGANALAFGYSSGISKPLLIVGGNCSILGFDQEAEEQFWTVTGDNVSAICFCDVDEDGQAELIVGSDDFAIRVFKAENILYEINEAARITLLSPIIDGYFA
jgi:Bardet-Biedl syndrome 2 protein